MKMNKSLDSISAFIARVAPSVALLLACFYAYDFYKCLSGAIANGFRNALLILPMTLAFLLPVLCFMFYFYDFYVCATAPAARVIFSSFAVIYAIADLVFIFANMDIYSANHTLGVYDALPSIGLRFPYDMIVVLISIIVLNVFAAVAGFKRESRIVTLVNGIKKRQALRLRILEYLALCVLAIVVFVFAGSALYAAFSAYENAFYDFRYVFLILWVLIIPMGNLVLLTVKPEKMNIKKSAKVAWLSGGIAANVVFGLLFWILELTYPDFLVHIGKPLFTIAFSVSLPIEPAIILGIMALSVLVLTARLFLLLLRRESTAKASNE